jgi:hypothetical protein
VQIPFERIGAPCEIVCETGVPAVPLLIPIVNLTALAQGAIPLHAAAFRYHGTGVVVTGWSKGGKTEVLLGFMADGAEFVGDEWVYLDADGRKVYGIPEPIHVWDWHLSDVPQFRAAMGPKHRARLRMLGIVSRTLQTPLARRLVSAKVADGLLSLLERQRFAHLSPNRLFGDRAGPLAGTVDKVLFVMSHDAPDVVVQPIDSGEIVDRMAFSLHEERDSLLAYYRKFRFAFPGKCNAWLERVQQVHDESLRTALAGKEAYFVKHPYPAPIHKMVAAIRPLFESP